MKPQRKPRLTCRKAISALILLFISLAFTTQAFALGPVLDVNATGANFEVGTKDFNLFFEQYYGGGITKIVDLNRDGRLKTNLASSNGISAAYTTNEFDFWYGTIGLDRRIADDDNSARLWKAEDLGSRAQIMASGALMDWNCAGAPKFDLNFTKTSTIYPIPGGLKVAVHLEFTDTNSAATNYAGSFANGFSLQNSGTFTYTDNNVSAPAGSEWWYAVQRYDLNSDYDANTAIARGYAKRAADSSFYNKKWDPVYAQVLISANMNGWFASSGLSQQFNAGETDYINYLLYFTSTRELGQRVNFSIPNSDENLIDYRMLDYRNPDDLFAKTGDFNYFDYNTGAYVLTADNNRVDFNISTNGIYNDHNNWDTNRYYPAFQIDSYFGSTAPVVKKNNTLLTQGIDYVSDVNTEGNYAVVVWLGALTGDDENAQFVMAEDLTAPSLTISSPSPGSSTASNSMNIKYSATDASGIKKYYIRMDGGEWLDNNFNITKNYPNLGAGEHTADVIAVDYADNNSATESVTFTLTAPALTVRYLDVNATGDNFEVGTVDFNMFFEQSKGGGIMGLADLNRDSVRKNLIETNLGNWHSMDAWFAADPAGGWREDVDDNAAQLWNAEDLNSRVKITASGALTRWGPAGQSISGTSGQIYDLNYVKTTTIYPIIGGFRAVVHNEFTDTNTAATNYGGFYHRFHLNPSIGIYTYQDNNLTGYFTGMAWWRAVQRTDLNSDFDTNAVMICGYDKFSTQRFFNGKWGPLSFNSNWGTSSTVGWYDADLSPEFSSGEMSYLNYVIVLTDTKQFGQVYPGIKSAADENLVDYYMLDYRNPDDLFMTTGTFQEFDFNTGAYLLNASHNAVDFNIAAANTQLTDHNTTDVNRYSPAFEIRNYTAITKPQLKYNGTLMTEGLEFVSDVNTSADYAVIVWLGDILTTDINAQFQMDDNFTNSVPTATLNVPSDANYLSQYNSGSDINTIIDFNVSDADNEELYADIYYSGAAGAFTNAIYADLNLNAHADMNYLTCTGTDWTTQQRCTLDWNISGITDGNYYIDLNISDPQDSNSADSSDYSFNIDNNAPAVTITSPLAGSTTSANSVNVKYSGYDTNGVKKYFVRVDEGAWFDNGTATTKMFFGLTPGDHNAEVIAQDYADNNSSTASVNFTLTAITYTERYLSVAQTGENYEVSSPDFNMLFEHSSTGTYSSSYEKAITGGITYLVDLNRDPVKTDLISTDNHFYALDFWTASRENMGLRRTLDDNGAELFLNENIGSRVKITERGAMSDWNSASYGFTGTGQIYDLNFKKTTAIYPTVGGFRMNVHMEFTDVNSGPTSYTSFLHAISGMTGMINYGDNNINSGILPGQAWWRAKQRTDLNSDFDANSVIVVGYDGYSSQRFYNGRWGDTTSLYGYQWTSCSYCYCMWRDTDLDPELSAGETSYLNYMFLFNGTDTLGGAVGQSAPDENFIDYRMLDYRNPDSLFMQTGTSQGFDHNTGAYQITAVHNKVDFNISTNGIYNDHNNWDTNRYSPAFEISNYTAGSKPLMKLNGTELTEGLDYISDFNLQGEYAVVVWLGDLITPDKNARIHIEDTWAPWSEPQGDVGTAVPVQEAGESEAPPSAVVVPPVIVPEPAPEGKPPEVAKPQEKPEQKPKPKVIMEKIAEFQPDEGEIIELLAAAGFNSDQIWNAQEISKKIRFIRSATIFDMGEEGAPKYRTEFRVKIRNTSGDMLRNLRVVETVPKSISAGAAGLFGITPFDIIMSDPVVEFPLGELPPGASVEAVYYVNGRASAEAIESMPAPIAMGTAEPTGIGIILAQITPDTYPIIIVAIGILSAVLSVALMRRMRRKRKASPLSGPHRK